MDLWVERLKAGCVGAVVGGLIVFIGMLLRMLPGHS